MSSRPRASRQPILTLAFAVCRERIRFPRLSGLTRCRIISNIRCLTEVIPICARFPAYLRSCSCYHKRCHSCRLVNQDKTTRSLEDQTQDPYKNPNRSLPLTNVKYSPRCYSSTSSQSGIPNSASQNLNLNLNLVYCQSRWKQRRRRRQKQGQSNCPNQIRFRNHHN